MDQAVVILGYREIRSIAITLSISDMFGTRHARSGLDRMKLWEHSIATAILADCIREQFCRAADGAFVCGLLHDIGIFVFDQYFSDEWAPVYIQCIRRGDQPLIEMEQEALGLNHATVGYLLAERWNLPGEVSRAIAHHHDAPVPQTSSPMETIVYVANAMIKQWVIGNHKAVIRRSLRIKGDTFDFNVRTPRQGAHLHRRILPEPVKKSTRHKLRLFP